MRRTHRLTAMVAAVLAVTLAACSDANSPTRVALAFTTRPAPGGPIGGAQLARALQNDTAVIGDDSIIITQVEIVLREIELERVDVADCPDDDAGDGTGDGDDGCEELSVGTMLVDLPLDGGADKVVTVEVAPGIYDELEFTIHAPDPATDGDFLALHPTLAGISIRVTGIYIAGGVRQDFTYSTDLEERQEIELSPPVDVTAGGPLNVTVRLDLGTWFVTADGAALVDPTTASAGGANEALVRDNIRNSIEAFHDDDSDGLDDDTEDDDGGMSPDAP